MTIRRTCQTLVAAAVALWASTAEGTQYLVSPGENWQEIASRARPGDEIILMPGKHRTASLSALRGEQGKPITIRGIARDHPAVITAGRVGITLRRPQYVVLENLVITGATLAGIVVSDDAIRHTSASDQEAPWPAHLAIRHVSVLRSGPRGKRHAIRLEGLQDVRMEDVRIEGWGGTALELVGCHNVTISGCRFVGLRDHSQWQGIQIRAGSQYVTISNCRFDNAGDLAISLGGESSLSDFRPPLADDAVAGSQFEARYVAVQRCTFIGSSCPISLINSDDCLLRNNTIVRPRGWVVCILNRHDDPRFTPVVGGVFSNNLVVWEPGDLQGVAYLGEDVEPDRLVLGQNLWWSTETFEQRDELGMLPGREQFPQITAVDPKLDDQLQPTAPQAAPFGADAP